MNNERTRLFAAMALAAVILFGWPHLIHFIEDKTGYVLLPKPDPATQPSDTGTSTTPSSPTAATQPFNITLPTPTTRPGQLAIAPAASQAAQPAAVAIGSAAWNDPTYAMRLQLSPARAGITQVALNNFPERINAQDAFQYQFPYDDQSLPLSTRSVTIDGVTQDLTAGVWRLDAQTERSATFSLDLSDTNGPVLTLQKTFEIEPRDAGGDLQNALGFDTKFAFAWINRTNRPLVVSSVLNGPTFLPSEQLRGGDRSVVAGYQGKNDVVLRHDTLESFTGSAATKDFTVQDNQPLLWIGAGGNYFNAIVRPVGRPWMKSATAHVNNPAAEAPQRQVVIELQTADVQLAPGARQAVDARVFFGPRKREYLKNPYYAALNVGYEHTLETSGSCAYCTFQWLVDLLMTLLGVFHAIFRDWGLSIIALVFVVRTCLHPITKRSQINMAKMGKMGPEIERIKKKHGEDKEALNRAMMDFYKTQGATPILGCLPMFLQMPIWIALYSGLGSTFELRQAPFLQFFGHNLTWIHDLSKPDHLLSFSPPINFFFLHFDGLNVIPILLAGAFFLQQKFTPKPPATTPEQQQQQKMMQWMTLLFPIMLYSSPSGLNLYILTSTTFGIIESRIIRRHIAEREALSTSGPTFIDGEVVRGPALAAVKPAGGIIGWWQKMQAMAEKAREDAEKQARQRRR